MATDTRPLAIVTGASAGIGYELAKECARNGFDLLVAADQPKIHEAAAEFRTFGAAVEAVEADLATLEGVDRLYATAKGRPVGALSTSTCPSAPPTASPRIGRSAPSCEPACTPTRS